MPSTDLFENEHQLRILQSIIETAIDGIFLIDTDGFILLCNAAGEKLFGYNVGELAGKNISLLIPLPHDENPTGYVQNYLRTGIKKIIGIGTEIEGLRKDGTLFFARLAVSDIILNGVHYFSGIIHDLTDVKKIEHELTKLNHQLEQKIDERTTELQDAINRLLDTNMLLSESIEKHKAYESALLSTRDELAKSLEKEQELGILKSRFISMASHEFKTPLASILSSAALISRYETFEQAEDRKRHIERIKASVTHLNTILSDFLSIARLEEGRFELKVSRFELDTIIADLLGEMEVLLKPDQTLTFEYKTKKLGMISDKNIIRNILFNLLSNAIKYSDEGSKINCKVKLRGVNIIIEIRDNGIGIPDQEIRHIGTRFFRASNVSHLQGTGLGLNIVRTYLNFMKGNLTFKSHAEKGTTFILTIPARHEK